VTLRRALYITYDGLLEPLGASQVLPLVEGLAGLGVPMEVISFEKPMDLSRTEEIGAIRSRLGEAGVSWVSLSYHAKPSIPATGLDFLNGSRLVRKKALEAPGALLVHGRGYLPTLMGMVGLRLAGVRGGRLLFDMRGFWVDERVEAGWWGPSSLVVSLARRAEKTLLARADHIVHLSEAGRDGVSYLAPGVAVTNGTVIPTLVDLDRFRPVRERRALRRALGLASGVVLIHAGTLSGWYRGEETFLLAKALVDRTGGEFVVLTREVEYAEGLARRVGLKAMIKTVPHREVPRWLQASDIGLALVRSGFSKTASVPTKIGEYLASGLVTVTSRGIGDLQDQFGDTATALALAPDTPVEEMVERVMRGLGTTRRMERSRDLARRHFDLGKGIQSYASVYRDLGLAS
jgi:glycosyltransferase involved in cell wall biosynthesis